MSEQAVRALPIWRGEIRVAALSGGLTNFNYRVESADGVFAVRTGTDDPILGIDRRNELQCTRAAGGLGLAPRVVHDAPGVLVSEFVDSTPLTVDSAPEHLPRIAAALRAIHAAGASITGHLQYFSPFQVARTYLATATDRGLPLPEGIAAAALLAEVAALAARIGPFTPTFCHNDMMPGNLLDAGAAGGGRLWVIDWEYAGIGHPLFDLAGLASNCEFDDARDRALLSAYHGRTDAAVHAEFLVMKAMAALRESLWAVLQGAQSTIDFDYAGYRDDNYRKYRTYRSHVA